MGLLKLKSRWKIDDDEIVGPFLLIPHGYGITKNEELPESAKRVLDKTIELMDKYPEAQVLILNSDYFGQPKEFEGGLKVKYLGETFGEEILRRINFCSRGIHSTLDEIVGAIEIYQSLSKSNVAEIISICDKLHARRTKYLWKKLYPWANFKIIGVDGVWDKTMPSFWQRSEKRWLALNIIYCWIYAVFGKLINRLHHKVT